MNLVLVSLKALQTITMIITVTIKLKKTIIYFTLVARETTTGFKLKVGF